MSTFNGSEGNPIAIATGAGYTASFRTNFPNNKKAYFVGRKLIEKLLSQDDAMGIRIYFGQNIQDDGNLHIMPVIVAADSAQNDIIELCIDESHPFRSPVVSWPLPCERSPLWSFGLGPGSEPAGLPPST